MEKGNGIGTRTTMDEMKRIRLMTYVCQRKQLFVSQRDYADLMLSLSAVKNDLDECALFRVLRIYIESCQRVYRYPRSFHARYQCSMAFQDVRSIFASVTYNKRPLLSWSSSSSLTTAKDRSTAVVGPRSEYRVRSEKYRCPIEPIHESPATADVE